ncbi:DUF1501 domain-containing protein [Tuwongella immobilis]|uniref:DUF1501 domain-containing protein n=1 Tax=Tuwongella immobilis TaxID=692036 RepID=A0A6C2YMS2_9BACT|nr:DUF1501 domain-containing protein [Tuwongella immobilis]VIP02413.1 secreted protein containing duf1501 : Uncharacterized protein OS=Chthoniobacter flavus Ellin428 GN=CfE428DRAFT_1051 PE=4 SV=1: DUF1501 [Tuwongella immobilis]VTS01324.1 secreted protein containing duf1501 : Uncharacterized protein OS=Chthoniobacter flavus Ellin428 GN=CfE428DRAFT_1051 PE=4 SV=1: DUF1501 [Tuwongella immobilis]
MICSRRHFLHGSAFSLGSVALPWLLQQDGVIAAPAKPELEPQQFDLLPKPPHHPPQAKAMISLFMFGGPSHIDLFDPKPELDKRDGQTYPGKLKFDNVAQATSKIMAAPWKFRKHGECGMDLSELLPHLGTIADKITLIRSMHTGVNNHIPSMYALNTGVGVAGRPSLGSWLLHALGSETQNLPAYVALTHPSGLPLVGGENWTNGWLPSIYQGTMARPTEPRILNLDPPPHLRGTPQERQLDLLKTLNQKHLQQHPGENDLSARIANYELAARMQLAAKDAFDISRESRAVQRLYGIDNPVTKDYGTRCLIARRLVERGVRFIQIFNVGQSWDQHGALFQELPRLCREVDQPAAALVKDLEARGLLDSTVVHWGGEMGRLPVVQGTPTKEQAGRDHNTYGFSVWAAGGGFKRGHIHGATDEFGSAAVTDIVTHHDWLATLLHLFGVDPKRLVFKRNNRELTLIENSSAKPVTGLLA